MQEILKEIRKQLRLNMNGVVSAKMRERGLHYKLNFGLSLPQIKSIAVKYTPSVELAETLWGEATRELSLMATLLYPPKEFSVSTATRWVEGVKNPEMADFFVRNLVLQTDGSEELSFLWLQSDEGIKIYCAVSLLIGLLQNGVMEQRNFEKYLPLLSHQFHAKRISAPRLLQLFWQMEESFPNSLAESKETLLSLFPKELVDEI